MGYKLDPRRKKWNPERIKLEALLAAESERKMFKKLVELLKPFPDFFIMRHAHDKVRHDYVICYKSETCITEVLKMEFECGMYQYQWKHALEDNRKKWRFGLNVLSRKTDEGKHFDIFLKSNRDIISFFCCTFEYVLKCGKKHKLEYTEGIDYETDDEVYSISWDDAKNIEGEFCRDNFDSLREMIRVNINRKLKELGIEQQLDVDGAMQ